VKAYLEPDEINRMEQVASNLRDRLLVHLLFHVGCRVSEALALKVEDVDFTRGTITIVHLKHRVKLSCPTCGARLGLSHTFCPKCGAKVDEAS
jgi:integrase/recombinase XerD